MQAQPRQSVKVPGHRLAQRRARTGRDLIKNKQHPAASNFVGHEVSIL